MKELKKKNSKIKQKYGKKDSKDTNTVSNKFSGKEEIENVSKYGDPNWYFLDKDLAEQASRFSFKAFIGDGSLTGTSSLPSILTFGMNPFIGTYVRNSLDQVAAVNMAARKLYARLSSKTGRTSSYAPQDVMTIILAVGEIISITSHLKRVLGLAFTYNYRNRDIPYHVIDAMGVDSNDLLENLSVYWVRLNTILNQINKIPIPANIAWLHKCGAMYQNVFKDSPDAMSQLYAFIPATTWKINETSYEEGTILETIDACYDHTAPNAGTQVRTFDTWLVTLNDMIQALLTSTSYNVVYADILNLAAKEDVALLHLDVIPADYSIEPVYDQEFLLHVHNMNIASMRTPITEYIGNYAGTGIATPFNDVYPDVNANSLIQYPCLRLEDTSGINDLITMPFLLASQNIVDFPYGDPDLRERIEATRYSFRYDPTNYGRISESEHYMGRFAAAGDHYCIGYDMYIGGVRNETIPSLVRSTFMGDTGTKSRILHLLTEIEKFDYHPLFYIQNTTSHTLEWVSGDVNYFTHLQADWLRRINDLAFQGLLELR